MQESRFRVLSTYEGRFAARCCERLYPDYIRAAADLYRGIFQPEDLFEIGCSGTGTSKTPQEREVKVVPA